MNSSLNDFSFAILLSSFIVISSATSKFLLDLLPSIKTWTPLNENKIPIAGFTYSKYKQCRVRSPNDHFLWVACILKHKQEEIFCGY